MQVYREAPILTAQPCGGRQARVPHLLYGHVSAREFIRWAAMARGCGRGAGGGARAGRVADLCRRHRALFHGADRGPGRHSRRRRPRCATKRARLLDDIGVEALHARLARARSANRGAALRPSDPQRVLRAYEVFEATGRPLAEWQERPAAPVLTRTKHRRLCAGPAARRLCAPASPRGSRPWWSRAGWKRRGRWKALDPALPAAKLLGLRPLQALAAGRLDRGGSAGRRHHRHAAICQAPDDVVSAPDGTLYLV